jgi:hypothetical protein
MLFSQAIGSRAARTAFSHEEPVAFDQGMGSTPDLQSKASVLVKYAPGTFFLGTFLFLRR